jgi:hypothetical protein
MAADSEEFVESEEQEQAANLADQAISVFLHTVIAIGTWAAMMGIITLLRPESVPVVITLALSFSVPFLVGNIITRVRQSEMAPYTWLIGLIWFLIICLWILDMPTGPNQCYHCDASQKIFLTFFSLSDDSWLIDGQGRLVGTWPAAAWIGYGMGARFGLRRRSKAT